MGRKRNRRSARGRMPEPSPTWWDRFKKHWTIFIGPSLVALGMQLMSYSAIVGTLVVYVGIVISILEVIYERLFLDNDYRIQVVLIGAIGVFFAWFTIDTFPIPNLDTPYELVHAVSRNPKLSEFHLAIRNRDDDNYEKMNFTVKPNFLVGKVLVAPTAHCEVKQEAARVYYFLGNARTEKEFIQVSPVFGLQFSNPGNMSQIAADATYTIYCATLPKSFDVRVAFIGISFSPQIANSVSNLKDQIDIASVVNSSGKEVDKFEDMLGDAPCHVSVLLDGTYKYKLWNRKVKSILKREECS